jgi:hypothetical protein
LIGARLAWQTRLVGLETRLVGLNTRLLALKTGLLALETGLLVGLGREVTGRNRRRGPRRLGAGQERPLRGCLRLRPGQEWALVLRCRGLSGHLVGAGQKGALILLGVWLVGAALGRALTLWPAQAGEKRSLARHCRFRPRLLARLGQRGGGGNPHVRTGSARTRLPRGGRPLRRRSPRPAGLIRRTGTSAGQFRRSGARTRRGRPRRRLTRLALTRLALTRLALTRECRPRARLRRARQERVLIRTALVGSRAAQERARCLSRRGGLTRTSARDSTGKTARLVTRHRGTRPWLTGTAREAASSTTRGGIGRPAEHRLAGLMSRRTLRKATRSLPRQLARSLSQPFSLQLSRSFPRQLSRSFPRQLSRQRIGQSTRALPGSERCRPRPLRGGRLDERSMLERPLLTRDS